MLSLCPLEEEEEIQPVLPRKVPEPKVELFETTECNYLVIFFLVSVVALALSDQLRR
jgi:hypothetical protein